MSVQDDDWRLQGQELYLSGATLTWKTYTPPSPEWDHDHCVFCWTKLATPEVVAEAEHSGYVTADRRDWVCQQCALDMRDRFNFVLVSGPANNA